MFGFESTPDGVLRALYPIPVSSYPLARYRDGRARDGRARDESFKGDAELSVLLPLNFPKHVCFPFLSRDKGQGMEGQGMEVQTGIIRGMNVKRLGCKELLRCYVFHYGVLVLVASDSYSVVVIDSPIAFPIAVLATGCLHGSRTVQADYP